MKITTLGVVSALKNLGMFFASFTVAGIQADSASFMFALLVYACISVPSDLLLLNHASSKGKRKVEVRKVE